MGLGGTASGASTALATADVWNGAADTLTAGTAYTVVILSAASYASVALAEDPVAARSTASVGGAKAAIIVYLDSTVGYARAFFDADLGADDALTGTANILNFTNITTLTGLAALTFADFYMQS